jgi:hypothetical protein
MPPQCPTRRRSREFFTLRCRSFSPPSVLEAYNDAGLLYPAFRTILPITQPGPQRRAYAIDSGSTRWLGAGRAGAAYVRYLATTLTAQVQLLRVVSDADKEALLAHEDVLLARGRGPPLSLHARERRAC